jgi:RNA recognition motif-containing protein
MTSTLEHETQEEACVMVNNLPLDMTESDLDALFTRFGPIKSTRVWKNIP